MKNLNRLRDSRSRPGDWGLRLSAVAASRPRPAGDPGRERGKVHAAQRFKEPKLKNGRAHGRGHEGG